MPGTFDDGAAWGQLLRVHAAMMRRLEALLRAQHQISHGEFEVLLRLSWAPQQRMRLSELAESSVLTLSGISRLVDRLARVGLLRREVVSEDARGAYAVLTDAGRSRLDAAEASTIAFVREAFLSLYTDAERAQMVGFWRRFLDQPPPSREA